MSDYKELGRAIVSLDTGTVTLPNALTESGFIGYVHANPQYDLTRNYLKGRVVDTAGNPIPNVAVNAIAGNTAVFTRQGGMTLPVKLYSMIHYGYDVQVAGVSILWTVGIGLFLGAIGLLVGRRFRVLP